MVVKYKGHEKLLFGKLVEKYGPEPVHTMRANLKTFNLPRAAANELAWSNAAFGSYVRESLAGVWDAMERLAASVSGTLDYVTSFTTAITSSMGKRLACSWLLEATSRTTKSVVWRKRSHVPSWIVVKEEEDEGSVGVESQAPNIPVAAGDIYM
ncbi:hypothetical protein B484DRAFT_406857 [Ochromonadaceae sp. CCMP2298]|nr:hypothetical protein B484DRAFT_406857 [Ochromonadaceae sp. CCMP2298]